MPTLTGRVLTPAGWQAGTLDFGATLGSLTPGGDTGDAIVLPGFIDTHVHGGGGGDTMDGPDGVRTLARFHARHGTTTLLPTTMTNPWARVLAALRGVREVMDAGGVPGGADIIGAHLEGPFISPDRLGAQPPNAINPTVKRVEAVLALNVIRVVTLAPEVKGAVPAAAQFARAGVRVSLGHTAGRYEDARAVQAEVRAAGGVNGGTHLYNAMGGLSGRDPGPLGALLADLEGYAELILDLHHVHPGSFLAAWRAKPEHLHLITDAIRAAGLPDGESELGGQTVIVRGGEARLESGSLAGSVLTLDQALRNAVGAGVPLEFVSQMLSATPARYLGLTDRGTLTSGLRADVTVLGPDLQVRQVYVAGVPVVDGGA